MLRGPSQHPVHPAARARARVGACVSISGARASAWNQLYSLSFSAGPVPKATSGYSPARTVPLVVVATFVRALNSFCQMYTSLDYYIITRSRYVHARQLRNRGISNLSYLSYFETASSLEYLLDALLISCHRYFRMLSVVGDLLSRDYSTRNNRLHVSDERNSLRNGILIFQKGG